MTEWLGAIIGAFGAAANGGWALRLESKTAAIDEKVTGVQKLTDERDQRLHERLENIERGQGEIRGLLVDALRNRR